MLYYNDFFSVENDIFSGLFQENEYVWEPLKRIKSSLSDILKPNIHSLYKNNIISKYNPMVQKTVVLNNNEIITENFNIEGLNGVSKGQLTVYSDGKILQDASVVFAGAFLMDDNIYIGKKSVIEPCAMISGPCYIGNMTEIRQSAYLRGNVIIGDKCVVGHTTEMKSSVMLGESKAGHFAYIGDSILGKVNLGAGTKLANLKLGSSNVVLKIQGKKYDSGIKKFGAIIGDGVETGCNTVTTPGTLLSKNVLVYPNTTVRGFYNNNVIVKSSDNIVEKST